MSADLQTLRDRWNQPKGKDVLRLLSQKDTTREEFRKSLTEFYGPERGLIVSETLFGDGKFIDYRGIDLSGQDLTDLDFSEDFSYANFDGCILDGALFNSGKFYYASFEGAYALKKTAQFHPAYLKGANFRNTKFKNAWFVNCDLREVNFTGAVFEDCDFGSSHMQSAIFEGTQMINCDGRGLHLSAKEKDAEWFIKAGFDPALIHWE